MHQQSGLVPQCLPFIWGGGDNCQSLKPRGWSYSSHNLVPESRMFCEKPLVPIPGWKPGNTGSAISEGVGICTSTGEISSKARGEGQTAEGKMLILWPHPSHLGFSLKVLAIVGLGLSMAIKAIRTGLQVWLPLGDPDVWHVDVKTNCNCCPVFWILPLRDTFLLCRNWWFFWNKKVCWQFRSLKCGALNEGYTDLSRSQMKCRRKSRLSLGDSGENMPALTSLCAVSIVKVPHFPWFDEDSRALKIWIAIIPKSNSIQFSSRPLLGNKTGISYFN